MNNDDKNESMHKLMKWMKIQQINRRKVSIYRKLIFVNVYVLLSILQDLFEITTDEFSLFRRRI